MDAFWASKKFSREKIEFGQKASIVGQDVCCQKIAMHFLDLDLAFLDEEDEEADEELTSEPAAAKE